MTPERATLIRETWREFSHRVDFSKTGPLVRLLPRIPLPELFPFRANNVCEVEIPPPLEYHLRRVDPLARKGRWIVECEGLVVDTRDTP